MDYYRKETKPSYSYDIDRLQEHIVKIYDKLDEYYHRFHLLNMRIHAKNYLNILSRNIYLFKNQSYVSIFDVRAKKGKCKYSFHLFVKSKSDKVKLHFLFNHLSSSKEYNVRYFEYILIEEELNFSEESLFKFYVKTNEDIQILPYSSFDVIPIVDNSLMLQNKNSIIFIKDQLFHLSKRIKNNFENIEKLKSD